jgi:hypothetical protein
VYTHHNRARHEIQIWKVDNKLKCKVLTCMTKQ